VNGWMKVAIASLGLAIVAVMIPSCQKPEPQGSTQAQTGGTAQKPADANAVQLTRDKVVEIANAELRRNGFKPEDYDVLFDQGNLAWRSAPISAQFDLPELKGHDYQSVKYTPRGHQKQGSDLFIFIDKNTGKPLLFFQVG
jgi:hypothetical protein